MLNEDEVKRLSALAGEQVRWEKHIAQLEEHLKEAKENHKRISEKELPAMMSEMGVSEFKLTNGAKITIKQDVYASLPKDNPQPAFAWLRDHQFGGVIRNQIIAEFGVGEDVEAIKAAQILADNGYRPVQKETVHPQTLKALLREQLAAGIVEVPLELFGAYVADKAKVELPK